MSRPFDINAEVASECVSPLLGAALNCGSKQPGSLPFLERLHASGSWMKDICFVAVYPKGNPFLLSAPKHFSEGDVREFADEEPYEAH